MKKETYLRTELLISEFDDEDVITTSGEIEESSATSDESSTSSVPELIPDDFEMVFH